MPCRPLAVLIAAVAMGSAAAAEGPEVASAFRRTTHAGPAEAGHHPREGRRDLREARGDVREARRDERGVRRDIREARRDVHADSRDGIDAFTGARIDEVVVERAGQPVIDARWLELLETRKGEPLSPRDIRETVLHFFHTGLFEDIAVDAQWSGAPGSGVRLTYRVTPVRTLLGYGFDGEIGLDETVLRRALTERFGPRPSSARATDAVGVLRALYAEYGYLQAKVDWAVSPVAGQDASELVFTVQSGPRARIGEIGVTGQPLPSARGLLHDLDIATGEPFDGPALERRRERVMRAMRTRGYYEANVHAVRSPRVSDGVIDLTIDVEPGPLVMLRFVGDPIDEDRRVELVPVAREASVDEDLLEDSKRRIERYLHDQGHWKAAVDYRREGDGNRLDLVFEIRASEVFRVARVDVTGAQAIPAAEMDTLLATKPGDLYVETALDARTAALVERYRREGYPSVRIEQTVEEVVEEQGGEQKAGVNVRLHVEEGPRMGVGDVRLTGNRLVPEGELRERLQLRPGVAYYEPLVATDRDALQNAYLDRGFDRARIEPSTTFENGSGRAIVTHTIVEGPQIVVDRILIVGNRRTSTETIERALTLKPGDPLGLSQLVESQRRLRALGLFTRVTMTDVGDPGATRRDLLVNVEEAPPTTISYGGGVEAGRRLTTTGDDPAAREKFEIAGRGFFDIGRRNLFGSNRSVNLFLAVSLRPPDEPDPAAESDFGFNEYRVLATFREPSVFGTTADGQLVGYFEQAIRSSFNFVRRGIQAEVSKRTRARTNLIGGYSLSEVRLYDERIAPEDRPDIDRLFPQVRLSKFSGAARRDLRDDVLDPTRGTVIGLSADTAARAIGSQVGFVKGFAEVFGYRQVPPLGRVVLAGGARLGLARGFTREAVREDENGNPVIGPDGQPIVEEVADLPASERFFAGGDTTVRGFARDSLGDVATLDPNGFPTGGNAVIILNGELRAPLWRELGGVVFVDVGNVFRRVTDIELSALRASAGFGLRYKSPVGPVRFDLGLKLDPQELVPGRRESRYALHFSIGQAF